MLKKSLIVSLALSLAAAAPLPALAQAMGAGNAADQKLAEIPMGRAAEPSEVASVVTFLASDMSSYMTGCVLEITGGRHI